MTHAELAAAARRERVEYARRMVPATLEHSQWFTPPPRPVRKMQRPTRLRQEAQRRLAAQPTDGRYARFQFMQSFVSALIALKDSRRDYRITVPNIQGAVCLLFGIEADDLIGPGRTVSIVRYRHLAMYLCRTLTPMSLQQIGMRFGYRDHTTILSGARKAAALIETDADFAADVLAVKRLLGVEGVE